MREATLRDIETFWSDLFGLAEDQLWQRVTVRVAGLALLLDEGTAQGR